MPDAIKDFESAIAELEKIVKQLEDFVFRPRVVEPDCPLVICIFRMIAQLTRIRLIPAAIATASVAVGARLRYSALYTLFLCSEFTGIEVLTHDRGFRLRSHW